MIILKSFVNNIILLQLKKTQIQNEWAVGPILKTRMYEMELLPAGSMKDKQNQHVYRYPTCHGVDSCVASNLCDFQ